MKFKNQLPVTDERHKYIKLNLQSVYLSIDDFNYNLQSYM